MWLPKVLHTVSDFWLEISMRYYLINDRLITETKCKFLNSIKCNGIFSQKYITFIYSASPNF